MMEYEIDEKRIAPEARFVAAVHAIICDYQSLKDAEFRNPNMENVVVNRITEAAMELLKPGRDRDSVFLSVREFYAKVRIGSAAAPNRALFFRVTHLNNIALLLIQNLAPHDRGYVADGDAKEPDVRRSEAKPGKAGPPPLPGK
jgi:hypothetical protein